MGIHSLGLTNTGLEGELTMLKTRILATACWLGVAFSWSPSVVFCQRDKGASTETTASSLMYLPGAGEGMQEASRASQYSKIIDDKNYELSTSIRVPSINGGERLDRETTEKSQSIGENAVKVERL